MRRPFAHQDASGMADTPLALFVGGQFRTVIGEHDTDTASKMVDKLTAEHGTNRPSVEVLTVCVNHPQQSAVDCLICDPMED